MNQSCLSANGTALIIAMTAIADVACTDIMGAGWRQQEARGREEGQVIGVSVSAGGQQVTSPGHSTVDSSGSEITTAETAVHRSTQRTGLLAFRESLLHTHHTRALKNCCSTCVFTSITHAAVCRSR